VFFGAWLYFEISTPDSALAVYLLLAALGAAGWWPIASTPARGPVAYGACLNRQIASLQNSPGIPNLRR
jgi:hypothetical protein